MNDEDMYEPISDVILDTSEDMPECDGFRIWED